MPHTTHRSADGRKGPVHGVRGAPQRGRPHRGRAAVRLLTEQRYRWRLERRRCRRSRRSLTRLCHTWRSIRFLFPIIPVPHFPPPVTWCRYFQSCIFHPCSLMPIIPVPHFQRPLLVQESKSPTSTTSICCGVLEQLAAQLVVEKSTTKKLRIKWSSDLATTIAEIWFWVGTGL